MIPRGIISILQTAFTSTGELDLESQVRLVEDAVDAGADALICTGVAGEVAYLSLEERLLLLRTTMSAIAGRVPLIAGVSDRDAGLVRTLIGWAENNRLAACMLAVPQDLYKAPSQIVPYFQKVLEGASVPVMLQDFQIDGSGMDPGILSELADKLPVIKGIKVETMPAGPKYTAVKRTLGRDFHVSGGWAVPQFIEAMDRGVDAMIPESAMVRVYKRLFSVYEQGDRKQAVSLFRSLLPVLSFTNQEVGNSIKFFKLLLVRKGIFSSSSMRCPEPEWDEISYSTAEELIELYLEIEESCGAAADRV